MLLKVKLCGEEHDDLFVRFISKIAKIVINICGSIVAFHTLVVSDLAVGLLADSGISSFILDLLLKMLQRIVWIEKAFCK